MKSKNIPVDIRAKSIKEAQEEIKGIIEKLENKETNLQETQDQYSRMLLLNYHIQDKFKEKSKDINNLTAAQHKKEK